MSARCSLFIATSLDGFIASNLINELTITLVPILLGSGRSLFGALAHDIELNQISVRSFSGGFVQNRFLVSDPDNLLARYITKSPGLTQDIL